jgi:hypothetical protein
MQEVNASQLDFPKVYDLKGNPRDFKDYETRKIPHFQPVTLRN